MYLTFNLKVKLTTLPTNQSLDISFIAIPAYAIVKAFSKGDTSQLEKPPFPLSKVDIYIKNSYFTLCPFTQISEHSKEHFIYQDFNTQSLPYELNFEYSYLEYSCVVVLVPTVEQVACIVKELIGKNHIIDIVRERNTVFFIFDRTTLVTYCTYTPYNSPGQTYQFYHDVFFSDPYDLALDMSLLGYAYAPKDILENNFLVKVSAYSTDTNIFLSSCHLQSKYFDKDNTNYYRFRLFSSKYKKLI